MSIKAPQWAVDLGLTDKIRPLTFQGDLRDHGLRGRRAKGKLAFSRILTRRQAKRDAQDGLPISEAAGRDQWSEREQCVAEASEDLRRGLTTWFSAASGAVRNYIRDCTPADLSPDQLREAIKAGESDLRHYEADDVADARTRHEETRAELEAFRANHKSQLGERTPDIKKTVEQAIAILLFVMIVEGCLNAFLFKDAQASGLLGGVLVAFGVSAVNVTLGVVAGFFGLRYLNHPARLFQIMGAGVAVMFIAMGVFLNFFVAHFRDHVEVALQARLDAGSLAGFSMFDIAPGEVIIAMFPNILGLESLIAIGLLFIGFGVFAIALYEGYGRLSDPYPGYGRVWRNERKAYEHRQQVRNNLRDDLADYFTATRRWFDLQQARHVEAKREIEKAMTLLEVGRDEATAIAARCADQERSLKTAYRQAHRRARNGLRDKLGEQAGIPAYFDEMLTPTLPSFEYGQEREMANAAIEAIDHNITALSISREWLETHIQTVQKGLSSIELKVVQHVEELRKSRQQSEAKTALSA